MAGSNSFTSEHSESEAISLLHDILAYSKASTDDKEKNSIQFAEIKKELALLNQRFDQYEKINCEVTCFPKLENNMKKLVEDGIAKKKDDDVKFIKDWQDWRIEIEKWKSQINRWKYIAIGGCSVIIFLLTIFFSNSVGMESIHNIIHALGPK